VADYYVLYADMSVTVSSCADTDQVDHARSSQEKSEDRHRGWFLLNNRDLYSSTLHSAITSEALAVSQIMVQCISSSKQMNYADCTATQ